MEEPVDPSNENVFYNTLLDQYMDRHYDIKDVLYSGWAANHIMENKPCRKLAAEDSDSSLMMTMTTIDQFLIRITGVVSTKNLRNLR